MKSCLCFLSVHKSGALRCCLASWWQWGMTNDQLISWLLTISLMPTLPILLSFRHKTIDQSLHSTRANYARPGPWEQSSQGMYTEDREIQVLYTLQLNLDLDLDLDCDNNLWMNKLYPLQIYSWWEQSEAARLRIFPKRWISNIINPEARLFLTHIKSWWYAEIFLVLYFHHQLIF